MTGVYILLYRKKVVYVGQTINWPKRLSGHTNKNYDSVRFIECDLNKLSINESRLIRLFKPEYNVASGEPQQFKITKSGYVTFNLRLKKSVLKALRERAENEQRAMNTVAGNILCEKLL